MEVLGGETATRRASPSIVVKHASVLDFMFAILNGGADKKGRPAGRLKMGKGVIPAEWRKSMLKTAIVKANQRLALLK